MNLSPAWFGWLAAELRERFTADQQDLISDMLVMPSFYA